jgi:acyl carrier protein
MNPPNGQHEPPEGDIETLLAQLWSEVLKRDSVGRNENFFELGGQSVQGMTLLTRVAERLTVRLPLTALFKYPTVQQMAQAVEQWQSDPPPKGDFSPIDFEDEM